MGEGGREQFNWEIADIWAQVEVGEGTREG